jgi:hypothetical protein
MPVSMPYTMFSLSVGGIAADSQIKFTSALALYFSFPYVKQHSFGNPELKSAIVNNGIDDPKNIAYLICLNMHRYQMGKIKYMEGSALGASLNGLIGSIPLPSARF